MYFLVTQDGNIVYLTKTGMIIKLDVLTGTLLWKVNISLDKEHIRSPKLFSVGDLILLVYISSSSMIATNCSLYICTFLLNNGQCISNVKWNEAKILSSFLQVDIDNNDAIIALSQPQQTAILQYNIEKNKLYNISSSQVLHPEKIQHLDKNRWILVGGRECVQIHLHGCEDEYFEYPGRFIECKILYNKTLGLLIANENSVELKIIIP